MFVSAQVPRWYWTYDPDPGGTCSDKDRGQQRDLDMLMEPVWSPDMQCAVQHTHSGLGWNLALIHTEYPSGRIPSSVVPSSLQFPSRRESTPDRRKHNGIKLSKCPNPKWWRCHIICLFWKGSACSNRCVYLTFSEWKMTAKQATCKNWNLSTQNTRISMFCHKRFSH